MAKLCTFSKGPDGKWEVIHITEKPEKEKDRVVEFINMMDSVMPYKFKK